MGPKTAADGPQLQSILDSTHPSFPRIPRSTTYISIYSIVQTLQLRRRWQMFRVGFHVFGDAFQRRNSAGTWTGTRWSSFGLHG